MYTSLNVKYPLFMQDFNETWIFPADFKKILKISRKSNQWDLRCPKQTDWQTNIMKLRDAFRNFENMPKTNET